EFDENLFPCDSGGPNPEEAVYRNDQGTLLRKALKKLPPNFREVLVLRELEELSYREIADITGMPAGTVMSSLSRARGRLRQVLTALMSGHAVPTSPRIAAMDAGRHVDGTSRSAEQNGNDFATEVLTILFPPAKPTKS